MRSLVKICLCSLLPLTLYSNSMEEKLSINGYGNFIGKSTDEKEADDFIFSGGFQAKYLINEKSSITAQLHVEEEGNSIRDYDGKMKWLYVDYYLGEDYTARAGLFQFPVFESSEMSSIGFLSTWAESPLDYYGAFGCDDFEGVELLKNFSYGDFDFILQLSGGQSENTLFKEEGGAKVEGDVKDLGAITLKTSHDNFKFNFGYLQARSTFSLFEQVDQFNFRPVDLGVKFKMLSAELEVDLDDYLFKAGIVDVDMSDEFPDESRYYASLERNYNDFTPYLLYSAEVMDFEEEVNFADSIDKIHLSEYTIGTRYDYSSNIAFKLSYSRDIDEGDFVSIPDRRDEYDTFTGAINVIF